jgi:hypothetical protein
MDDTTHSAEAALLVMSRRVCGSGGRGPVRRPRGVVDLCLYVRIHLPQSQQLLAHTIAAGRAFQHPRSAGALVDNMTSSAGDEAVRRLCILLLHFGFFLFVVVSSVPRVPRRSPHRIPSGARTHTRLRRACRAPTPQRVTRVLFPSPSSWPEDRASRPLSAPASLQPSGSSNWPPRLD